MKLAIRGAILTLSIILIPQLTYAATRVEVRQLTNTPYQERDPIVWRDTIAYTNYGGSQGIDIWAHDRKSNNHPLIERPGSQFLDAFNDDLVVYEELDDATQQYAIRLYNTKSKKDIQISSGTGSYGSGGTNGDYVTYIEGGACGKLMLYHIKFRATSQLADTACTPKISKNWVIWNGNGDAGPGIYGYNLDRQRNVEVNVGSGAADTINLFEDAAVWMQTDGTQYKIMYKDLRTGKLLQLLNTSSYYVNYPAVSDKYVVWGKSTAPGQAGVEGINLKSGEVFEIYPQGPHQNTNLTPSIWCDVVTWQAWRTGNGDIYSALIAR